ncbi:MAG: LysR family transcriptional regulator [Pseudomonadota bacterium]
MIEIGDIQVATQISKSGSIQLAASEIGLTQPALTKRLKAIEGRLGFDLFHRMPRGVKLTRLGELFLTHGAELMAHAKDMASELERHKVGEVGSLRIGVRPCIQSIFFRKSLIAFSSTYPGIHLKIDTRETHFLCDAIRAGQLDFGIIGLGYEDDLGADPVLHSSLTFEPLFRLPISIVVRKDHPVLASKTHAEALLKYPIACEAPPASVWRSMTKRAQAAGLPFEGPRILVDDYDFILRLVARSDFWTSVFSENERELRPPGQLAFLRVDELIPPMTIGICARKNWAMPRVAQTLVDALLENVDMQQT